MIGVPIPEKIIFILKWACVLNDIKYYLKQYLLIHTENLRNTTEWQYKEITLNFGLANFVLKIL